MPMVHTTGLKAGDRLHVDTYRNGLRNGTEVAVVRSIEPFDYPDSPGVQVEIIRPNGDVNFCAYNPHEMVLIDPAALAGDPEQGDGPGSDEDQRQQHQ